MKKMKKSLKYVLLSLALVAVFAVATVAGVLIFRKDEQPKPVEFTKEQVILLDKISSSVTNKQNETNKTLVQTATIVGDNNVVLSQDDIYAFYNGYFVANDANGNKIMYLSTKNGNINIFDRLKSQNKLLSSAQNVTAVRVYEKNLLYSYEYTASDKTYKTFEILSFENLENLVVLNSISFEIGENDILYRGGNQVTNVKFSLSNGFFEISYNERIETTAMAEGDESYSNYLVKSVYVYGDNEAQQTSQYENNGNDVVTMTKSENQNIIINALSNGNADFVYKTKVGDNEILNKYSYVSDGTSTYKFFATNFAVFVEKKSLAPLSDLSGSVFEDGKNYVYSYEYFDIKTEQLSEYKLSNGMVKAEFVSEGDYLVVFERSKNYMVLNDEGFITYFDETGEAVLRYVASSIESVVLHSNNERFVTNDGIFVGRKTIDADLIFDFESADYDFVILSENISTDWFVVRDEIGKGSYMMNMKGELAFDSELFVSIVDFGEGYFLTSKNGKRHLCVPSKNEKTLIENYTGFYEVYLPQFGFYLSEVGENIYDLYNFKNELLENDVALSVVARENYICIIASKTGYEKLYCLTLSEDFGENTYYFANSDENNETDSEQILMQQVVDKNDEQLKENNYDDCNDCEQMEICQICESQTCDGSCEETFGASAYDDETTEECSHSYSSTVTSPTCTAQGYTTYTCSKCGNSYKTNYTSETGHSYSSKVTTSATCTSSGVRTYTCSKCNNTYTESIPATGHNYVRETQDAIRLTTTLQDSGKLTYSSIVSTDQPGTDNSKKQVISYSYPTKIYITQNGYSYYTDYVRYTTTETIYCQNNSSHNYVHTYVDATGLDSSDYVTVDSQDYEITISESNGQLIASGGTWSVTITENFTNVGVSGTIDFDVIKTLVTNYSPNSNGFSYSFGEDAYYQPQELLEYDLVFHKDTPYYETSSLDHDCSPSEKQSSGDKTYELTYFEWSDFYFNSVDAENLDLSNPSAMHYTFDGWYKGSTYSLNLPQTLVTVFDGYAFDIGWTNNGSTVNLAPIWTGNTLDMVFYSGYETPNSPTKIYVVDEGVDSYSYGTHLNTVTLDDNDEMSGKIYFEYKNFASGDSVSGAIEHNVAPASFVSTLITTANSEKPISNNMIGMRNYIHIGWAICNSSGTEETYTDFTTHSDTFTNIDTDVVHVVAVYRIKEYNIEVINTPNEEASWRDLGTEGSLSGAYNDKAIGYVDRTTIEWAQNKDASSWTSLNTADPTFSTWFQGYIYFRIDINVKAPNGTIVTKSDRTASYYRFDTITISNYYDFWGNLQDPKTYKLNYTQNENNIEAVKAANWENPGNSNDDIYIIEDGTTTNNTSSVIIAVRTKGSLTFWQEKGCTFTIEILPIYDQTSNKTVYEDLESNVDFKNTAGGTLSTGDAVDGFNIYNVGVSSSKQTAAVGTIISSAGEAYYVLPSFISKNGVKVDETALYNNTHMLVIEPKTSVVYTAAAGGSGGVKSSKVITNYISSISAQMPLGLWYASINDNNPYDLDSSAVNGYTSRNQASKIGISNILDYHMLSPYKTCSNENKINYNGKEYVMQGYLRVGSTNYTNNYGTYFDIFVGRTELTGDDPYEYDYAYFIFYDGKINFNITMTDIDLGKITVNEASTNIEYNETTALNKTYKNNTSLAEVSLGINDADHNLAFENVNGTTTEELDIEGMNVIQIKPNDGFLIEEITIVLTPINTSASGASFTLTYTLDYENADKSPVAILENEAFKELKYKYEMIVEGQNQDLSIHNFVDFMFAVVGRNSEGDDAWTEPTDNESKQYGTVWLGFSKLIDQVTISYEVVSYLDVLFNQYKVVEADSYLKNSNLDSDIFNSNNYQSDFVFEDGNKVGTWFNDTTLSQIYITGSSISVENSLAENDANFYYQSRMEISANNYFSARSYTDSSKDAAYIYKKIVGYLLNKNSYFSIKFKEDEIIEFATLDDIFSTNFNNKQDVKVEFETLRQKAISALEYNNINLYALEQNSIKANYFADPVTYKITYNGIEHDDFLVCYYDQQINLADYSELGLNYKEENEQGYSFVGWVSTSNDDIIDKLAAYNQINGKKDYYVDSSYDGYWFTNEEALASVIGSSWYFGRNDSSVATYFKDLSDNVFTNSDFYVDEASFITDSGYYNLSGKKENYNFLCAGFDLVNKKHTYFADDGRGVVNLTPIWMANDYTLKFNLQDIAYYLNVINPSHTSNSTMGSTETLFRINNVSEYEDYLGDYYKGNLNNGFNYKLYYGNGHNDRIMLETVDYFDENDKAFYVYVRYDTKDWYFSDSDGSYKIYYQKFFDDSEDETRLQVNADRYGYTFINWLMGNDNKFNTFQMFDSDFYEKCLGSVNTITELSSLYYDYENHYGNENINLNSNKIAYEYGQNGVKFVLEDRESEENTSSCRVNHFVTNRLTDSSFRTVDIVAEWKANEYTVRVFNDINNNFDYHYQFVNDANVDGKIYGYPFITGAANNYYESSITYVFDQEKTADGKNSLVDLLMDRGLYRHGYEFAGWTFAYDQLYPGSNQVGVLTQTDINLYNDKYSNYWYEQLVYLEDNHNERIYQHLCNDLLLYYNYYLPDDGTLSIDEYITNILYFNDGEDKTEQLGDYDDAELLDVHYIDFYANWVPMLYTIEVDLNLPEVDGETIKDIAHEVYAGLFESLKDGDNEIHILCENGKYISGIENDKGLIEEGFSFDSYGIAAFNYMLDNKTYKAMISNFSFKIYYGEKFSDARVEFEVDIFNKETGDYVETKEVLFKIADLFVKINNFNFTGWTLFGYNGDEWTQIGDYIDFEDGYFENFADDWHKLINYGTINTLPTLPIYRDVVVIDDNIEIKDTDITERLYVEDQGHRYYLSAVDHEVGSVKNTNYNFDDQYLMVVVKNEDGEYKEYYLYNYPNGAYYVVNTFENQFDEYGNATEFNQTHSTNVIEVNFSSNNLDNEILTGLSFSNLVINKTNLFKITANWEKSEEKLSISANNLNNDSTAKIIINNNGKEEVYNVYYKEDVDESGNVIKNLVAYIKNTDGEYEETIINFYYSTNKLTFDDRYLKLDFNVEGTRYECDILIDEEGNPYCLVPKQNGALELEKLAKESFTSNFGPFNIQNMHHFGDYSSLYSNGGLGGIFEIKVPTATGDTVLTPNEITKNADETYTQIGNDIFSTTNEFLYEDDVTVDILPYYNGRYLTEISFEFKHIFEDEIFRASFSDLSFDNNVDARLVFDMFWDNENRTIGIDALKFYRLDSGELVWSIVRNANLQGSYTAQDITVRNAAVTGLYNTKFEVNNELKTYKFLDFSNADNPKVSQYTYLNWWLNKDAIDTELSKGYDEFIFFIEKYFNFMLSDESLAGENFISIGQYVDLSQGLSAIYQREDVNLVSLKLKELKKEVAIGARFSVQTFDLNVYSILNNSYDSQIPVDGENINTPYNSISEMEEDIDYGISSISKNYDYDYDLEDEDEEEYPKYATILNDSGTHVDEFSGFNVPYGYFAYGYAITSSYIGDRPIDLESNPNNKELLANPIYGFDYIYTLDKYYYKDKDLIISAENSDLINSTKLTGKDENVPDEDFYDKENKNLAQNAPVLGNPENFSQSVRADKEVLYYDFGGLFFIQNLNTIARDNDVKFRSVTKADESAYMNQNYHIFAYYYIKTSSTETGFYAWDDESMMYQRIEDIRDGYAYYEQPKTWYYQINEDKTISATGDNPAGNYEVMYTFTERGVDTEEFAKYFNTVLEFETEEEQQKYLEYLKMVAQTYWFICNDGEATLDVSLNSIGLLYDEKSKMFKLGDNYYALQENRRQVYYGATLYKKVVDRLTNKVLGYEIAYSNDENIYQSYNSSDEYVVFNNYYVYYNDQYYKIDIYYDEISGYYNPLKKYSIDTYGRCHGNSVVIEGKTYYFNYEDLKLYEANKIGVEAADFKYQIVTPVNENFNLSVIERENGYGIYGVTLNSVPDSSVAYWMPGKEFLFWAAITEADLKQIIQYEADTESANGKIYSTILNKYITENPGATDEQRNEFIKELNDKLKKFTFEDLIRPGILVKGFTFNGEGGAVDKVKLQFVVDLGIFEKYNNKRLPVNIIADFDILQAGAEMVSSLYAVQIYQKVEFSISGSGSSVDADNINKGFFELYGDTIYYYCDQNFDIVRFANLSYEDHQKMLAAEDRVATLNQIIKDNKGGNVVYPGYANLTSYLDESGNVIYDYEYAPVNASGGYLYAFYYKANMPEGADPYVVAVADGYAH